MLTLVIAHGPNEMWADITPDDAADLGRRLFAIATACGGESSRRTRGSDELPGCARKLLRRAAWRGAPGACAGARDLDGSPRELGDIPL